MVNAPVNDYNKCLAVLMLRTADCSQEATASYLGCGKKKVVAIEKWFRELRYRDAASVCFDNALDSVFVTELEKNGFMTKDILSDLKKLDSISVLMRYCQVKTRGPRLHPRPSEHQARLAIAAEKLRLNIKLVKGTKGAVLVGNITRGNIKTKTKKAREI
jgi:hypothetical protein